MNVSWMKIIFCLVLMVSGYSCMRSPSKFVTKPIRNIDTTVFNLNLNGVYYGYTNFEGHKGLSYFLFYNNGVTLHYHHGKVDSMEFDSLRTFIKKSISTHQSQADFEVGGFDIKNNQIQIQVYGHVPGMYKDLYTYNGTVLTDSTMYINTCSLPSNPLFCRENFALQYLKIDKPDSTHRYMKKKWYWRK